MKKMNAGLLEDLREMPYRWNRAYRKIYYDIAEAARTKRLITDKDAGECKTNLPLKIFTYVHVYSTYLKLDANNFLKNTPPQKRKQEILAIRKT